MKKIFALLLALVMCLPLSACRDSTDATDDREVSPTIEESGVENAEKSDITTNDETEALEEPNYAEIVADELHGVWLDTYIENILSLYAFKDNNVETYVVNIGVGAANALVGTYAVEDGKVTYDFGSSSGYSNFTYENGVLSKA